MDLVKEVKPVMCCFRLENRLAISITMPVNTAFRAYLENTFRADNILEYIDFMKM